MTGPAPTPPPPTPAPQKVPTHRIYVDETGDHTRCSDPNASISKVYLGLCGVIFHRGRSYTEFAEGLDALKKRHLRYDPDDPPVLHRRDMIDATGAFAPLQDPNVRTLWDQELLGLVSAAKFAIVMVACNKQTHGQATYRRVVNPYSYCLIGLLERACGRLSYMSQVADLVAESRGGTEDMDFKAAYSSAYAGGSMYLKKDIAQRTLSSKHAKLKKKDANIAGLQLADLLAHPLMRDVLVAYGKIPRVAHPFADKIVQIAQTKYNARAFNSQIDGYGRVYLP